MRRRQRRRRGQVSQRLQGNLKRAITLVRAKRLEQEERLSFRKRRGAVQEAAGQFGPPHNATQTKKVAPAEAWGT